MSNPAVPQTEWIMETGYVSDVMCLVSRERGESSTGRVPSAAGSWSLNWRSHERNQDCLPLSQPEGRGCNVFPRQGGGEREGREGVWVGEKKIKWG